MIWLACLLMTAFSITQPVGLYTHSEGGNDYYVNGWGKTPSFTDAGNTQTLSEIPYIYGDFELVGVYSYRLEPISPPDVIYSAIILKGSHAAFPEGFEWSDTLRTYSSNTSYTLILPATLDGDQTTIFLVSPITALQQYEVGTDYSPVITVDGEILEVRPIHDRERDTRESRHSQNKGEGIRYKFDFSRLMTERGESVSSATWEAVSGSASISNTDLTSNIASADVTTNKQGMVQIKVTATQADGNKRVKWLKIQVIDPDGSIGDY